MQQRVSVLDGLRGLSLLGILIANMLFFQYGDVTVEGINPQTLLDKTSFYFTKIAVEGSFYPIFGFIFGYGLIKFYEGFENRGVRGRGPLWRRIIGLMVIGGLHTTFIWDGDILLIYGSVLVVLLLFMKRKPKTLFIWGTVFAGLVVISAGLLTDFMNKTNAVTTEAIPIYSSGSYMDILNYRLGDLFEGSILLTLVIIPFILIFLVIASLFLVGPFVLFGMGCAKKGVFINAESEMKWYKRLSPFIPLGLLMKCAIFWDSMLGSTVYFAGTFVLAIGYIAGFTWLFTISNHKKWTNYVTNLGRLSMTNYLLQSVICTTIFYGYGLGYFRELGVTAGLAIAIVIFAVQLLLSTWYLKKFKYGPVEYILRLFIYLRKPEKRNAEVEHGPAQTVQ